LCFRSFQAHDAKIIEFLFASAELLSFS